jgi:5'-nucleotidase
MNILVTNDDGYRAEGIHALVRIMRQYGSVTVVAPKYHQSGMGMSVSMGLRPIAVKRLEDQDGVRWYYVDGTPASCVKYAVDEVFTDAKPDLVVCGINHGSNAATAACYSGTLGAAQEAAVNGILGIGVSLDNMRHDADFSAVEKLFPQIFEKLIAVKERKYGLFYNVNFPNLPVESIKGVRVGHQGMGHWEREFRHWDEDFCKRLGIKAEAYSLVNLEAKAEDGEEMYVMVGDFIDDPRNTPGADHHLMAEGYISVTAHQLLNCDESECQRLRDAGIDTDFQ